MHSITTNTRTVACLGLAALAGGLAVHLAENLLWTWPLLAIAVPTLLALLAGVLSKSPAMPQPRSLDLPVADANSRQFQPTGAVGHPDCQRSTVTWRAAQLTAAPEDDTLRPTGAKQPEGLPDLLGSEGAVTTQRDLSGQTKQLLESFLPLIQRASELAQELSAAQQKQIDNSCQPELPFFTDSDGGLPTKVYPPAELEDSEFERY